MNAFLNRLSAVNPKSDRSHRVYAAYDQLSDRIGPLGKLDPADVTLVLVESREHFNRRPYHRRRIALSLANQRHFAIEQANRGVRVEYVVTEGRISAGLEQFALRHGPLELMEPAERELREELKPLVSRELLRLSEHEGWLTSAEDLRRSRSKAVGWRMDAFYRLLRQRTGILMDRGRPVGGKYSLDAENRLPWRGDPAAPDPPRFPIDEIKREAVEDVCRDFPHHPGAVDAADLPSTLRDSQDAWSWAKSACLPFFGPFEDAMSHRSAGLFHTRLSALLNMHRILPEDVVEDALSLQVPLSCKEGFVRQVLGWREFVYQVHRATDGFRAMPEGSTPTAGSAGDGGYSRWAGRPWPYDGRGFGGACPSALGAANPLPPAWWGVRSGLACLDTVVADVWREGWSHHITRLMILANIASLLDVDPRQLTDWFWAAYTDSYDWVVEPNVLGMGSFAVGSLMTTKPYAAGANYISRMSDYCELWLYDPAADCPLSNLYWAYLARHADVLETNPRMPAIYAALRKRSGQKRRQDAEVFDRVLTALSAGEPVSTVS